MFLFYFFKKLSKKMGYFKINLYFCRKQHDDDNAFGKYILVVAGL